jgi:hypothetical protein
MDRASHAERKNGQGETSSPTDPQAHRSQKKQANHEPIEFGTNRLELNSRRQREAESGDSPTEEGSDKTA